MNAMPNTTSRAAQVAEKLAKVNRTQVARELGLDRSYVSQVLQGKRMPGLDVAAGIAGKAGVSLDAFHGWMVGQGQGQQSQREQVAA